MAIGTCVNLPEREDTPHIGIFWRVQASDGDATLLVDCVPMAKGEPYGEFLNHGSHYDYWIKLASMSAGELSERIMPDVARWTEYEEWPRGRIVYHCPTNRFILYADRKLQTPKIIQEIIQQFSLPADRTDVRGDAHYVSVRSSSCRIHRRGNAELPRRDEPTGIV